MVSTLSPNSHAAKRDVTREPMMKALRHALQEVEVTGDQLAVLLMTAMDNNSNQKLFLSLSPPVQDSKGESSAYFGMQGATYRNMTEWCRSNGLIEGINPELQRQRS